MFGPQFVTRHAVFEAFSRVEVCFWMSTLLLPVDIGGITARFKTDDLRPEKDSTTFKILDN